MTSSTLSRTADEVTPLPRIERSRRRVDRSDLRRIRRPAALALAALIGIVIVVQVNDRVVGAVIHQQRQHRLAADFRVPAPDRQVGPGDPIAVIQSAAIELNEVVVEGDSTSNLRGGPARRSDSALPGEPGRTVILGHGGAFGGPLGRIDELVVGDVLAIQTRNGGPIVAYVVREVLIGADGDDVPEPDDGVAQLVLVSSNGGFLDVEHVVVVASTLPVIETEAVVGEMMLDASDRGFPIGSDAVVANVAALAAAFAWFGLRGRHRVRTVVAVIAPMAALSAIGYLLAIDTLLPSVR